MSTPREQLAVKAQGGGLESVIIPKLPHIPPPVDPRLLPAWYERFYREMESWREKTNQAITSVG